MARAAFTSTPSWSARISSSIARAAREVAPE
jgi:hypothetical protein